MVMKNVYAESIGLSVRKRVDEVAGRGLTLDHQSYLNEIELPEESYGICQVWYRNTKYGRSHNAEEVVLANGLCVDCWDKGLGGCETYNQRSMLKFQRGRRKDTDEMRHVLRRHR